MEASLTHSHCVLQDSSGMSEDSNLGNQYSVLQEAKATHTHTHWEPLDLGVYDLLSVVGLMALFFASSQALASVSHCRPIFST